MTRLTASELAGFGLIVAAFITAMTIFDVEAQSWTSFGLLAAFFVLLYVYRSYLRRHADG